MPASAGLANSTGQNLYEPNIDGKCRQLTICRVDGGHRPDDRAQHGAGHPQSQHCRCIPRIQNYIYAGNEDHDFPPAGLWRRPDRFSGLT